MKIAIEKLNFINHAEWLMVRHAAQIPGKRNHWLGFNIGGDKSKLAIAGETVHLKFFDFV